ncbi:TPM domain-containing protein [Marinobacter sp. LN3S78]|uniref:TPM domain-containing protein n=1 Tax=Marinobacter sp. LN3S78 TaxID=3382300 RepID=UPI00387AED56
MPLLRFSINALALLLLVACSRPDSWLEDHTGLLSEGQAAYLENYHAHLLEDHGIDYRVVIEDGHADINRRSVEWFENLAVGGRSENGKGLLLLLDPEQDQVRIEVSQALEGVYPDALISYLEHRQMVPFFRDGRVADGIVATTELIVTRAQEAEANQAFDPSTLPAATGGAGATVDADLGKGRPSSDTTQPSGMAAPQGGPRQTVDAYLHAMDNRNDNPDLPIYTGATRRMLAEWTMTPAQMDNVVRAYRACSEGEVLTSTDGQFAVLRYGMDERQCSPWFLQNAGNGWKLDLTVLQQAIGFGRDNTWHFRRQVFHRYRFAFMDWRLDGNGYPHSKRELRWGLSTATNDEQQTFVIGVQPASAAAEFGFQWGDRLVSWNGTDVEHHRHALQLMGQARTGEEQTIIIERAGQSRTLQGPAPEKPDQ